MAFICLNRIYFDEDNNPHPVSINVDEICFFQPDDEFETSMDERFHDVQVSEKLAANPTSIFLKNSQKITVIECFEWIKNEMEKQE